MIVFLFAVLIIVLAIISYKKYKRVLNVVSIFSFIWFFFASVSSFSFMGRRIPSLRVYFYVIVFVIIVDVIILVFSKPENRNRIVDQIEPHENNRYIIVQITALALCIPLFIQAIKTVVLTGSFSSVRLAYFAISFGHVYEGVLFKTIPMGMLQGLIIFYVFTGIEGAHDKRLGYALLNTILVTFINGGRYTIMLLIYSIVIIWMHGKGNYNGLQWARKHKKALRRVIALVFIVLLALTFNRGQSIIRSAFGYYSGSLSFLDYILANPTTFDLDKPLFGYLTFSFILEPIVLVLKYIGLTTAKIPSYYFNIVAQPYYNIGNATNIQTINANTSILYYFLRDFGFIGIVIGACLLGFLTVYNYNKWKKREDDLNGMLFLYMANVLFNSLMTYQLFSDTPLFIFLTLLYVAGNHERRIKIRVGRNVSKRKL